MSDYKLHPAVEALNLSPGTWEVCPADYEEYWRGDKHYNVGDAVGIENEADAHVLAASKEMLSLLVEYMTDRMTVDFHARVVDVIRRASNNQINL